MKNSTTQKKTTKKPTTKTPPVAPSRLTPTVNYNGFLRELCRRIDARNTKSDLPLDEARLHDLVETRREQLDGWLALGNTLADVLENPATDATARNTLEEELMDMADKAHVFINDPVVLRLLYPLLRYRTFIGYERFQALEAQGGAKR